MHPAPCTYAPPSHPDPDRRCPACGGLWRFHAIPPSPPSRFSTPPDIAQVRRAADPAPVIDRNGRAHDPTTGRFLADPALRHDIPRMADAELLAGLRKLWFTAPTGTKARLARLFGFRGPHARRTLRGIVRGTATLMDAQRRHISRILRAIERKELVLVKTDLAHPDGRPVYLWRWIGQPKEARLIPLPAYRRPGRPRKTGDGGVAL